MTDPEAVRAELGRLARGDPEPPWDRDRVIERAAAVTDDVEAAAAFAADGRCERLRDAIEAAKGDGNEALAAEGRAVLTAFERFERACCPATAKSLSQGSGPPGADGDDDSGSADRPGPLPPRSRNS